LLVIIAVGLRAVRIAVHVDVIARGGSTPACAASSFTIRHYPDILTVALAESCVLVVFVTARDIHLRRVAEIAEASEARAGALRRTNEKPRSLSLDIYRLAVAFLTLEPVLHTELAPALCKTRPAVSPRCMI
jgi:hypothetical protein